MLHSEEESFDGATPLESVPVLRQCHNISPFPDSAGDVELDDLVVIRSIGVLGYDVLVVRLEAVRLQDHPDGFFLRVVRIGLTRCLGADGGLLGGSGGGGRRLAFRLGRQSHDVFDFVLAGGLVVVVSKRAAPATMPTSVPEGTWGAKKGGSKTQSPYSLPTTKFFEFR